MARVARMAGALLVETEGAYVLVGHLKQPCDFVAAGFAPPVDLEARAPCGLRLEAMRPIALAAPRLWLDAEGDAAVRLLVERLLVERTSLVSERLWRVITHAQAGEEIDARWLGAMPAHVWQIVKDDVLRCA